MKDFCRKHAVPLVIAFDIVVLGVLWYLVPWLKRPLDGLAPAAGVLGIVTAVVARRSKWLSSAALIVMSLGFSVFALEMAEKTFSLSSRVAGLFRPKPEIRVPGKYQWDTLDPETYIAARERALRDGIDRSEIFFELGGDVFAREGIAKRRVRRSEREKSVQILESASEESPWLRDLPLGSELRPNNIFRVYGIDEKSGTILFDGVHRIGPFGYRTTRGDESTDEAYVFMGCSFMFGQYLNDDQTLPHYFSELRGFDKRVVNLAIGGNGPHHSLRDLELDYRLGRASVKPGQVKAVVYGYLDQHASRIINPTPELSPRYVLENGRATYAGTFVDTGELSRLRILLSKSRLYRALRGGPQSDFELSYAIFAEMNRICRERYNIPLTVLYWDDTPEAIRRFREMGVRLVLVSDALGKDWNDFNIKYRIFDMHPSPTANRLAAKAVHEALAADEAGD